MRHTLGSNDQFDALPVRLPTKDMQLCKSDTLIIATPDPLNVKDIEFPGFIQDMFSVSSDEWSGIVN